MQYKFKQLFGDEWYSLLQEYLHSPQFLQLGSNINNLRKNTVIHPSSDKVFRIFKELSYSNINIIILSMDPYNDGSACGRAFCNSESLKISPSLKIIQKEIELEYPETVDRFEMPYGGLDKADLNYLIKQGVFLYNTSLTVEHKKPGSHTELWREFTSKVIEVLNTKEILVWILMGKQAQSYLPLINSNHKTICCSHPASEAYKPDSGFFGSGIFRQCNFYLNENGRKEIEW